MTSRVPRGESLGVAGGGLDHSTSWAVNASAAKVGQAGELRTARLLDAAVARRGGATVLHDLRIPGSRANVDHVVVSGQTVWVIDTKVWAPGVYWRLGSRAYRGLGRFELAEKKTTSLAVTRLRSYLERRGVVADFATPTVVVWPSSSRHRMSLILLRRCGDSPVVGGTGFGWALRSMTSTRGLRRRKSADQTLVSVLSELLVTGDSPRTPATRAKTVVPASPVPATVTPYGSEDDHPTAPKHVTARPAPAVRHVDQLLADPYGDPDDEGFGQF